MTCNLRDLQRNAVWGWEFQPLFLGTGREVGRSSVITHVWDRGYRHSGVLTHCAFAIGFTPKETPSRNYWDVKATSDSQDTRRVYFFSPSYAGRATGRVRVYTAILWRSGAPSAAAEPYTARFSTGYATPVLKVRVPQVSAGDTLVIYLFENRSARAVAQHTFGSAGTNIEVEVVDNDETLAYPYVNASAAFPYGPAVSFQGRIIVLDNSVWVSSQSDSPQFAVYPLAEQDGFRILVSDPVERILMLDGQPVVVGSRQAYRLVFQRGGGGDAVPYPTSVQSDTPLVTLSGRLEDYDAFVTREGLITERGLAYKLPEDWYRDAGLQSVWVVKTPYGAALVRHYGSEIIVAHPVLTLQGYQWTTLRRESGNFPALRDVRWIDGLTLFFASGVDAENRCAIRLRQGTQRVNSGRMRMLPFPMLHGVRTRQIKLYGQITSTAPITVRLRRADESVVQTLSITQAHRPYAFTLTNHKLNVLDVEFEISQNAVWDGAMVRVAPGQMP